MPVGAEGRADSKEFTWAQSRHPESLQRSLSIDIDYLINEEPNTQAASFSIHQHCPLTFPTEHHRWDRLFKRTQAGLRSRQRAMQVANAKNSPYSTTVYQ
jgi:hypothetical protein